MSVATTEALPAALTVSETARLLHLDRKTAYKKVAAGEIPSFKLGSTIRVPTRRLFAMLEEQQA